MAFLNKLKHILEVKKYNFPSCSPIHSIQKYFGTFTVSQILSQILDVQQL